MARKSIRRILNFAAGPATLPEEVLAEARDNLLSLGDLGIGICEISHRSKQFAAIIEQAEADGNKEARESFALANRVEKIHHQLYEDALAKLRAGAELKESDYYVCQYCGNTVAGEPPAACPVCGRPKEWFKKVE